MTQGAETEKEKPGWRARMRERRHHRKERRAWRRERRKGSPNPYDAHNQAESGNYQGGFFKKE
jgi:hypothetical protein